MAGLTSPRCCTAIASFVELLMLGPGLNAGRGAESVLTCPAPSALWEVCVSGSRCSNSATWKPDAMNVEIILCEST